MTALTRQVARMVSYVGDYVLPPLSNTAMYSVPHIKGLSTTPSAAIPSAVDPSKMDIHNSSSEYTKTNQKRQD